MTSCEICSQRSPDDKYRAGCNLSRNLGYWWVEISLPGLECPVMPEIRRCPQCQAQLPPDAPDGVWPQCVLGPGIDGRTAALADPWLDATGTDSMAREAGDLPSPAPTSTTPFTPPGRFVPSDPQELAHHFPQLEIHELLGQGGMGAVYKARQRRLDRLVALKILPPEVAGHPGFEERFVREAQALGRLNHPHIVTLYDFGEAGGLYYFLMEFVEGVNLRPMIADGALEPRQALAIVPQICEALQYAHDEGVVHRDIKPENLLVDKKGRVKIADFGLVKLMRSGETPAGRAGFALTGSQQVMGTPHYMAPEQMERPQGVDHRADIYSLGVVFYEMLTGELPLGRFAPPSRMVQIDVRLDEVVMRTLEKEPARRYQQVSDVKTDVESISRADPGPSSAESAMEIGPDEFHSRDPRSQVALPAVALGLVGGVGFLLSYISLLTALNFVGTVHESLSIKVVLAALTLPVSVFTAAGAAAMAKASMVWARPPRPASWRCCLAMSRGCSDCPQDSTRKVLNRPDVQVAFQGKAVRTRSNALAREGLVIAVGCLISVLLIGAYLWPFARNVTVAPPMTIEGTKRIPIPSEAESAIPGISALPSAPRRLDDGADGACVG